MQRRKFLKSAAGAATLILAGGAVWRADERGVFSVGKGPAFRPWTDWQDSNFTPLALVRAAILAASPHNTQPWLFKVSNSSVALYLDSRRNVGALDPYLREEHIGLGCALENMTLAAKPNGFAASVSVQPGVMTEIPQYPPYELAAEVNLKPATAEESDLYRAIPHRHTNRNPYESTALSGAFVSELQHVTDGFENVKLSLFSSAGDRARIVELITQANDIVYSDPQVNQGTERWVRRDWNDVQQSPDGLTVDEAGRSPLNSAIVKFTPHPILRFIFRHNLLRSPSYTDILRATPLFGIISVRDRYDRAQSLVAGRVWQRAHLLATARGIAGRPVNEAVELVDHQRLRNQPPEGLASLCALLQDSSWQPTFMFRMGLPVRQVGPSPRRPVKQTVL